MTSNEILKYETKKDGGRRAREREKGDGKIGEQDMNEDIGLWRTRLRGRTLYGEKKKRG